MPSGRGTRHGPSPPPRCGRGCRAETARSSARSCRHGWSCFPKSRTASLRSAWRNSSNVCSRFSSAPSSRTDNLDGIAEMNLAQVAHMAFGGEGRAVARLHVGGADTELQPEFVDRPVEHHIVIGHVEMAVIVDPLRLDLHHRRQERRGSERRSSPAECVVMRSIPSFAGHHPLTPYISFATVFLPGGFRRGNNDHQQIEARRSRRRWRAASKRSPRGSATG